ncbi:hypothetical protein A2567_00120 [Candidatus Azambacteria bacterium RIFOXYD1_FULL_42_11]|uniref:Radical SAM core domain-containing protein n=1 Tax=Candidatus Azambacteria bacterium RIFOXYD1_FULL_42_11 TaxID=1797310 RepID=A0A1F5CHB1_9BACT|nr:MAG: hypothetical protein A2567_00120 [Candidatus Azambacteria bacterium RIFOXYD1_FULL_42_11]
MKRITKNVFAFWKGKKTILFNRINFQRVYLENNSSPILLYKAAKALEKKTPSIKFKPFRLKKVRVEATPECNCRCDYCLIYKNNLKQVNSPMDRAVTKKIVAFYQKNIKHGSLMIIGAEPLLNWPAVKLFIKKIKDPIKIFSNGTIINQEILDTLRKNQNVKLIISLDGRRVDNRRRKFQNGKETYSTVLKNIKIFRENGCNLGIACLCTNENVGHLYKIAKFFANNLRIKYLGISFPHYIKKEFRGITDLKVEKYAEQMIKIFEFAVKNKIYVDQLAKRFSPLVTGSFRFYACKLLGEQKTFYPNGEETFCTKIDSLNNSQKYNLEYFQSVIPINNEFCQNCPAIGICGGGCFWDGITRFKNGVDERECILNNRLLEHFLWNIYFADKKKITLGKKFKRLIL